MVGFIFPLPLPLLLPFELEGDTLEILVGAPVVGSIFPLPLPFPLLLPCVYEEEEISGFDLFRHVKRRNGATADNCFCASLVDSKPFSECSYSLDQLTFVTDGI